MAVRMQQRRATAEQWLLADPILEPGEIGYETDTNSFKIGDGINNWSLLDYFETSTALQGTIDDYIPLTEKGAALGVAELDANGFVPSSQLDIDLTAYYTSTETDTAISTAVSGLVDSAPGVLDTLNELAAAIGDDADFATTITSAYQAYADQAETDAVTTANAYTDTRETAITASYQAYADTAEADAISAAATDATTKADAAESAATLYTDTLIGDVTVDGTGGNTVTDRIATAISNLIDSAPGALDTLNELSSALGNDANFATTVTNSLATKASTTDLTPHPFVMVI